MISSIVHLAGDLEFLEKSKKSLEMAGSNCSRKRMDELEEIRISVRGLVEFLLKEGDIDNRRHAGSDDAMQEGSRIHRMIQKRMGAEYQAEVNMRYTKQLGEYALVVEGRRTA